MTLLISRRLLLLSATATALPNFGSADPDERPTKKPKKKKKQRKAKLTREERLEVRALEQQRNQCRSKSAFRRGSMKDIDKDIANAQRKIDAETKRQLRLSKTLKAEKEADRKARVELRRGKNSDGTRHTLKQKDALVRQINKNTGDLKKRESAVKASKKRVKSLRREQARYKQEKRDAINIINKGDSDCKAIDRKLDNLLFD